MRSKHIGLCLALLGALGACATNPKPDGAAAGSSEEGGDKAAGDDVYVSNNFVTLTYSLSNNSLTSRTVQTGAAKGLASELEGRLANPAAKDKKDMIALMATKRLAGEGVGPVFQIAKKLMIVEMREDIRRNMPEVAQLELALASIHSKQFPMAEHWIEKLMDSKNDKTKAAALTAKGMIAMFDGRLPEAVSHWNEALNVRKDYEPARLNIGFTALRFGDARTAKAMLSGLSEDWFVQTGLMQAERLLDNPKEAANLCGSILAKRKNYKPALFSCALNEYQGLGNATKARKDLEDVVRVEGGPQVLDEKAMLIVGKIDREAQAKEQAAANAAAAAKAAQEQQAAPPAQGAPQQGTPQPAAPQPAAPQQAAPAPAE